MSYKESYTQQLRENFLKYAREAFQLLRDAGGQNIMNHWKKKSMRSVKEKKIPSFSKILMQLKLRLHG